MSPTKLQIGEKDLLVNLESGDKFSDLERYGRWNETPKGRYLVPGYLSGSDYSGTLVERSNRDVFEEEFEAGQDHWWKEVVGGHGTFAIVIDTKGIPSDIENDVVEFLNNLHDYPLASEEHESKLEVEAQEEAWNGWAKRDFIKALEKKFNNDFEGDVDEELLRKLFDAASEASNTYWNNERGDTMYIDIERIVKRVTKPDFDKLLKSVKPW